MRIAKTTGLPDRRGQSRATHGDNRVGKRHPLYKVWAGILRRCNNPHEKNYERYGGRGIRVCVQWRDYAAFKADMAPSYQPGLSIDRKDNNGNYEPSNCRWATRKEQCRNRRSSRWETFQGETKTVAEWAEVLGFCPLRLEARLMAGWTVERAFTEPVRKCFR